MFTGLERWVSSYPRRPAALRIRLSGSSPRCPEYVPAESAMKASPSPFRSTIDLNIPSAAGDLQILPWQTKSIFIILFCSKLICCIYF